MKTDNKPSNLEEAIEHLMAHMQKTDLEKLKNSGEATYLHHGLGTGIRNSFGLWDRESILHKWFKETGIWHADDMSSIILESLRRALQGKPIELESQVSYYQAYWEKMRSGQTVEIKYEIGDKECTVLVRP